MAKEDVLTFDGTVTEVLGNSMFRVTLTNDHQIVAHLGGRLRQNKIKIILGDEVECEMTPYDLSKGRIIYRK